MLDALRARFDNEALRAPEVPVRDPAASTHEAELRGWCFEDLAQPFVARTVPRASAPAVAALACDLDGSFRMLALGPAGRLHLRLATKLNDLRARRTRRLQDPWDCGHARADLVALGRFRPRRATLVIAGGQGGEGGGDPRQVEDVLARNAMHFRHPVRLLVIASV